MIAKHILPALAAVGYAAAQAGVCSTTTTVASAAEATALGSECHTVKGDVIVSSAATGSVDLGGLEQISGDLKVEDNGKITTFAASSLSSIGGLFTLNNVTIVSTLQFPQLSSVGGIEWKSLPALQTLIFTRGVTKAKSVIVSDTFLSSLDGIDVVSLDTMDVNNNRRLTDFTIQLGNLSTRLNIQANGQNLKVSLPNLLWIANMTIANVSDFSAPSLVTVNGSARFDSNYFTSFNAPNLTSTKTGDISFVGNSQLTNITFPVLTAIGGGLLIANNTGLDEITGFPKVKSVGGAVKLRGNFTDVEFPSLNDVKGAFDVSSTGDIASSCKTLGGLSSKGGGGQVQGTFSCTSNNTNANQDTGSNTTSGGSGGGKSDNGAAGIHVSTALLGLAVIGGLAHLL